MIVLTVCNHKGGTGKTTSAMHLAAALGLSGHRTLVVDLDPQAFLTRMLGVGNPSAEASSLALFESDASLCSVPVQEVHGFDLLPASGSLTHRMRALNKPTDVFWAKETLQRGCDYDVVLFDTAAAVTVYSLNALVASRYAVIPVTPEYQPTLGAEQTHKTVRMVRTRLNPSLKAPLFLFTQVDARKRKHHTYRQYLRDKYGDEVMQGIIRTNAALATSQQDGTTVFDHSPYSRGARDYANAVDELLRRIEKPVDTARTDAPGHADEPPSSADEPPSSGAGPADDAHAPASSLA